MNEASNMDRANTLTEVRSEVLNESTRSLLLINGGGAVAVAAWLQAVWPEPWAASMLLPQVLGIGFLLVGVVFAAVCPFLRYLSFFHRNTAMPLKNPIWWIQAGATTLSVVAFLVGMTNVMCGAWSALP
jgi:polyferredoxin